MSATQDTIQQLIRLNRESLHQLVDVECATPEDHARLCEVQARMSEQINLLMQLREESGDVSPHTPRPLFGHSRPGAVRGRYLNDSVSREEYMALLRRVLRNCFSDGQFRLPDGSTVPAHKFLACLYDIGISQGIATASRQVKAFCALVHEAARGVPDISGFKTAYNTVIEDIRGWKNLLHADKNRKGEVLLHTIEGFEVREDNRADYNQWMRLREKVLQTIA